MDKVNKIKEQCAAFRRVIADSDDEGYAFYSGAVWVLNRIEKNNRGGFKWAI